MQVQYTAQEMIDCVEIALKNVIEKYKDIRSSHINNIVRRWETSIFRFFWPAWLKKSPDEKRMYALEKYRDYDIDEIPFDLAQSGYDMAQIKQLHDNAMKLIPGQTVLLDEYEHRLLHKYIK